MKLTAARVDAFIKSPDAVVRAALIYGPDAGLVRERAIALAKTVVDDLADPFRVSELSAAAVESSPAVLADDMAALSLMGGRRLVRVRDADDGLAKSVAEVLEHVPLGDTLLIVEAGDLSAKSKLRALFDDADNAVAIPCYVEEDSQLERTIGGMLHAHGLSISPDALAALVQGLVADRSLVRSEVDKLALYMGAEKRVELAHVQACIRGSENIDLDAPAWAAGEGDAAAVDRTLEVLLSEGHSSVSLLRMAQRHFDRLYRVATRVAAGETLEAALGQLRPPLFFKDKAPFAAQARRWPPARLAQALTRLVEVEADCKRTGAPDALLCSRVFHQLARLQRPT